MSNYEAHRIHRKGWNAAKKVSPRLSPPHHRQLDPRKMRRVMIDPDRSLLEIPRPTGGNINKGLRVHIHQGKPAALHLHHNAVPLFKGMRYLIDVKSNLRHLPRRQRLGLFKTVAELTAEYLCPDQPLIAIRQNIYQLYHQVRVRTR